MANPNCPQCSGKGWYEYHPGPRAPIRQNCNWPGCASYQPPSAYQQPLISKRPSKSRSRILYLIGLGFFILSGIILVTTPYVRSPNGAMPLAISNTPLGVADQIIALIGMFVMLYAWLGALLKLAELKRWGWFAVIFICSFLGFFAMLLYVFIGPETVAPPRSSGYSGYPYENHKGYH